MGKKRDFHKGLQPFLNCKDFTVSGESYEVMFNKEYDMMVTSPIPVDIENYYKSEDYISHTDSKKSLFDKVYQGVKNITLKKKLSLINSRKKDAAPSVVFKTILPTNPSVTTTSTWSLKISLPSIFPIKFLIL